MKKDSKMPSPSSRQNMIIEELRIIQNDVKDLAGVKDILARIEIQVTKTNGRVSNLEAWRNRIVGAMGVLGVILGWVASHFINIYKGQ